MNHFFPKTKGLQQALLLLTASLLIGSTGFGQKNTTTIPADESLQKLVNKHIKTEIIRQVQPDGSVFLQRNFSEYLHASPAFTGPEPQGAEADHGHDHNLLQVEVALNRPHPSVATLEKYFKSAAATYKVPVALLRAYAQVQSNWTQVSESMYGSWGIMGLIENPYTHQIAEAAALTGISTAQIKTDAQANIQAAAALLAQYQGANRNTQNPQDWFGAIGQLTGLPEKNLQASLAQRVYRVLSEGSKTISLWGEIIRIENMQGLEMPVYEELEPSIRPQGNGVPDYPAAILNYTTCNFNSRPSGATNRYYFVHYIAVGTYEGTISWFKNCSSQVSAHYVVRNFDGQVTQMVDEANRAWSQGVTEYNDQGIGVEHEVQVANLSMWDSQPMLNEAGKLCSDVCNRNNIPKQRRGINGDRGIYGHSDVRATDCPNLTSDRWNVFLSKVLGALPAVGTPTLWSVQSTAGEAAVQLTWRANTEANLMGYRLYYAKGDDLNNWSLAANENTLTASTNTIMLQPDQFLVAPTEPVYHYRLAAVVSNGTEPPVESGYSDAYSASPLSSGKKVLIVDGFDRSGGSYKNNVHAFAVSYFKAMRDRGLVQISTAANEKVEDGTIALTGYDLMVWFVGDESSADVVFSANEKSRITTYLDGGGNLLVSGSEIAYNIGRTGAAGFDINFMTNYLKATYVNDGNASYTPSAGTAGSSFEGLNMPFGIVYPEDFPDAILPANGAVTLMDYSVAPNKAAIGYQGTFGTGTLPGSLLYVAFPIETASDVSISAFFEKAFAWFGVAATPAPPITMADLGKVKSGKAKRLYILNNDNGNGLPLQKASLTITTPPAKGTVVKNGDGSVVYKANKDATGPDAFQYKVANNAGVFSGNETVTLNIEADAECGGEPVEVDDLHPLRSLRGAWVTSVFNLDWPTSRTATPAVQQAELLRILDTLKNTGFNTIYLQVRTGSDAFYASSYEPWSFYLTGVEGNAPSPLWDPLAFAVEAAHARGLDLHAWINPYRARTGSYALAANHVINQHPDWILTIGSNQILNPGLPEVRTYLKNIMADIASRYDVDGIHFDDYFYPSATSTQDNATYATYNTGGFTNIGDWRRDNVNQMIAMVYDTIHHINTTQNRNVVFGVSPFGIWKAGTPPGISGTSSFSVLYCDPIAWLQAGKVDYVAPQLYWKITGAQDYNALSQWWNDQLTLANRHLYTGQAWYKMIDANNWAASEIEAQIAINRQPERTATLGEIGYRTAQIMANSKGLKTALQQGAYRYKSYAPPMSWKDAVCPNAPANVRIEGDSLRWDAPGAAADGDFAVKYVVYKYAFANEAITLVHDGTKVIDITRRNALYLPDAGYATYVVSALDKNNNESTGTLSAVPDVRLCPGANVTLQGMVSGNQFQWQIRNGETWENLNQDAIYSGTNSYSLQIAQLPLSAYGTQVRCVADGTKTGPEYTIIFGNTWTPTTGNSWGNGNNWSCGSVPTIETDVLIPGNVSVFPVVDIPSAFARSLNLQNGAQLNVAPGNHLDIRQQ